jgi:hypothetical protein
MLQQCMCGITMCAPPITAVIVPSPAQVTFLTTNWNMTVAAGHGPQFIMDNVTAWAAGSFGAVRPLVEKAIAAAHSVPPFACIDDAVPAAKCAGAGHGYASRGVLLKATQPASEGSGTRWLAPTLAVVLGAVVGVRPPALKLK